jgi:hypothetical protein
VQNIHHVHQLVFRVKLVREVKQAKTHARMHVISIVAAGKRVVAIVSMKLNVLLK